jgi:anti-anti-sigma regulatory factor
MGLLISYSAEPFMIDLSYTKFHKVFLTEAKGDVLIVSPTGEAFEFRHSLVISEMNTILEMLDEVEVCHLIIDLGKEEYYGSVIIGAINSMVNKVIEKGGKVATCNASEEMQSVVKIMNLTERWPNYPTRRKALKAVNA